jgi:hypothetical protein
MGSAHAGRGWIRTAACDDGQVLLHGVEKPPKLGNAAGSVLVATAADSVAARMTPKVRVSRTATNAPSSDEVQMIIGTGVQIRRQSLNRHF